jgi:CubicO group peptidase (beta-lactamase class C family)
MYNFCRAAILVGLSTLSVTACQPSERPPEDGANLDAAIIDTALSDLVNDNAIMGGSVLVYRDGEEFHYADVGMADREADRPWQRGTLATIYSMTKPITGVTLMTLYEDGLFALDAPLSDYLPEYENMSVIAGTDAEGEPIIEAAREPIKVIDILRQTACFGYGWEGSPAATLLNDADVLNPSKPLSQFSRELATVPLYCQPGTQWKYGVSVDVQARLAEVLAGKPYEEVVQERVLGPLGLSDTRYFVPSAEKSRLAAVYSPADGTEMTRVPDSTVYGFSAEKPIQINGGHGLISSIDDYMRFARMLQNEGELDGVRILKPETVALMTQNQLTDDIVQRDFLPSKGQVGFGLDFAVRTAPPASADEPFGVTGEFFWDGAASPLFWVDPKNDVTVVFLTQVMPFNMDAQKKVRRAVYESLGLLERDGVSAE